MFSVTGVVSGNACQIVSAAIKFSRCVGPYNVREREGKGVLCTFKQLLQVCTTILTSIGHEVDNWPVVPFNNDFVRGVGWEVPPSEKYSMCRTSCFSVGSVDAREEGDTVGGEEL